MPCVAKATMRMRLTVLLQCLDRVAGSPQLSLRYWYLAGWRVLRESKLSRLRRRVIDILRWR